MHQLRIPTLITALATVAVLTGCGSSGSSGVTASAYVKSICTAVAPFERDVLNRSGALDLTSVKSPAQGKQALQGFLQAVASDTNAAVTKLKAAGTPKVANGKQISTAILKAFTQLKLAMQNAVAQSRTLSTTSAQAFKTGAESLGNTVKNSMSSIGQNLQSSTLKSADLQKAAAKEPACRSLGTA